MKKAFVIILICILFSIGCSNKNNQSQEEVIIDKNVSSQTLLKNLDSYVDYDGTITDNKKLILSFDFKKDVTVPENPPIVEAKVYLWMDDNLIGIYDKPLYNCYKDYLNPVTLTFEEDGKLFNRYEVLFNANSSDYIAGGSSVGELVTAQYPNGLEAKFVYARDPEGNIDELQSWSDKLNQEKRHGE